MGAGYFVLGLWVVLCLLVVLAPVAALALIWRLL